MSSVSQDGQSWENNKS